MGDSKQPNGDKFESLTWYTCNILIHKGHGTEWSYCHDSIRRLEAQPMYESLRVQECVSMQLSIESHCYTHHHRHLCSPRKRLYQTARQPRWTFCKKDIVWEIFPDLDLCNHKSKQVSYSNVRRDCSVWLWLFVDWSIETSESNVLYIRNTRGTKYSVCECMLCVDFILWIQIIHTSHANIWHDSVWSFTSFCFFSGGDVFFGASRRRLFVRTYEYWIP